FQPSSQWMGLRSLLRAILSSSFPPRRGYVCSSDPPGSSPPFPRLCFLMLLHHSRGKAMRRILLLLGLALPTALVAQADPGYRVGIVSESGDIVTWLKPGDGTLTVEKTIPVGIMPADIDGPHNLAVAPDNSAYYITIVHGTPYASLWTLRR